MKHDFEIAGKPFSVTLEGNVARLPGGELSIRHWSPGHLLLSDGRSLEYAVERLPRGEMKVFLLGAEVTVHPATRGGGIGAALSDGSVTAPMNGQVVKILRQTGDSVAHGEVILVLEAMKMENEVAAPLAGRLELLAVNGGQAVAPGDLLFRIQPEL